MGKPTVLTMFTNSFILQHPFYINYLLLKSTIDSIISSDDSITKEKILSVISDQFDSIKEVKVTDTSVIEKEMKDLASSYVSKVDNIYFEVGDDILWKY